MLKSIFQFFLLLPLFFTLIYPQEQEATTVGGYGELHYNEPDGTANGTLDFHRFVIYLGHSFSEKLSFKSETEIEHTKIEGGQGGEVAIEQAYLDWHLSQVIGLKAGIILPPLGIMNQFHEPPAFHGVERPNFDRYIIPSTWREAGAGFYGTISEGLNYQLYIVAGLKASEFDGKKGIREGRQEALESETSNPSFTGRVGYAPMLGLKFGGSFFIGNTTEGNDALGAGTLTLFSGDVQYEIDRLSLRGVGAFGSLTDADKINRAFAKNMGDQFTGFYVEGAYNIMPLLCDESEFSLSPFVRYEKYNTQAKVTGFIADPEYNRTEVALGASFKPTFNTIFKMDYQFFNNAAEKNTKQFDLGIGYNF